MIPGDPEALKKMQELADRNIANGDWGDEVTIQGLDDGPLPPEEQEAKAALRALPKK